MPAPPPKSITVGGRTIAIRIDPDMEHWGEYRADSAEIVLAGKTLLKSSTLRETLRHEIMHASLDIAGLSYLKQYDEEPIVRAIDNIFHPAWDRLRKHLQ